MRMPANHVVNIDPEAYAMMRSLAIDLAKERGDYVTNGAAVKAALTQYMVGPAPIIKLVPAEPQDVDGQEPKG